MTSEHDHMAGFASGLHHTGYTVSDLDRSVAFYRDLLGCELLGITEREGGYLAAIVGYPDAHVRMAHLRVADSAHIIELFQYVAPEPSKLELEPRKIGTAHLCFLVEDLTTTYERLLAHGVEFISAPVVVDVGANSGGRALYLRDPDGIPMELFQLPPRRDSDGVATAADAE
jgi:catechol 2,3-dioxygenase-like lactoylglutathione lyase family enzyme